MRYLGQMIHSSLRGSAVQGMITERVRARRAARRSAMSPEPESFPVRRCLGAVVNEEWEHRLYAERDLDVLESRPS